MLKKIEGREQDYIVNKKKELIPAAPLLFDYNIDWSNVEKFQIEQVFPNGSQWKVKLREKLELDYCELQKYAEILTFLSNRRYFAHL